MSLPIVQKLPPPVLEGGVGVYWLAIPDGGVCSCRSSPTGRRRTSALDAVTGINAEESAVIAPGIRAAGFADTEFMTSEATGKLTCGVVSSSQGMRRLAGGHADRPRF